MDIVDRLRSDWTIRFGAESKEDAVKRRNAMALEATIEIESLRKERDGERKRYADLADGFWRIVDSAQIKGGLPSCELNALSRIVDRLAKAERERDEARAALKELDALLDEMGLSSAGAARKTIGAGLTASQGAHKP